MIKVAYEKAKQFEQVSNEQKLFRKLLELQDYSIICELVGKIWHVASLEYIVCASVTNQSMTLDTTKLLQSQ